MFNIDARSPKLEKSYVRMKMVAIQVFLMLMNEHVPSWRFGHCAMDICKQPNAELHF